MNFWSLGVVLDEEQDVELAEEWTIENWFTYPLRRSLIFVFLTFMGTIFSFMIPINFVIVPVIGLLAWVNNMF